MLPSTFLAIVLASWAIFHLLHNFALSSSKWRGVVERLLTKNNIYISLFQVKYFTQRFNRLFIKLANLRLDTWFTTGVVFSGVAMVLSSLLLSYLMIITYKDVVLYSQETHPADNQVLTVMVPGVNLPIEDLGYVFFAIFVSGVLHEAGHAIAAIREDVHVNGFGVFMMLLYPGAYVDVDDMSHVEPLRKLRVYCAGVWHNFILSILACVIIISLPTLLSPFFATYHDRIIVSYQVKDSPLNGRNGLQHGDYIQSIDDCVVTDPESWFKCINQSKFSDQTGSCVSRNDIEKYSFGSYGVYDVTECCDIDAPHTHICYKHDMDQNTLVHSCLPARIITSQQVCHNSKDCGAIGISNNEKSICAVPHTDDSQQRLMQILIERNEIPHKILYLGVPDDLLYFISISQLVPRLPFLPTALPATLLKTFQYLFSISSALGLLNIIPCFALDGQWAFVSFFEYFYGKNHRWKERVCMSVLYVGTLLVFSNVALGLINVIMKHS